MAWVTPTLSGNSPHVGSVIQTILALVVLTLFVVMGLDPVLNLFVWLTQLGTLAVLGLMAVTSFAIMAFFQRDRCGETALSTLVLPLVAGAIMAVLFVIIFRDFGALTGASGVLSWALPSLTILCGLVGYVMAARLSASDPARFSALGQNQI